MKDTARIAVGVFMGAGLLLLVINTPGWIDEQREFQAKTAIFELTPESVIRKCGTPLKDETETVTDTVLLRTMTYRDNYGGEYRLRFMGSNPSDFRNPTIDDPLGVLKGASHRTILSFHAPCLAR